MKKATSKVIFKLLSRSNVFLITFLLSLFLFSPVFAWTEPSQLPPEGNVPPPLNQGIETAPSFQYTWDKIGIGTDLPVNNLHVYGNTEQSIRIQATADSAVLYLQAGNPDTSSPSQIYQAMDQDDLRFWVSGGDKMIIDSLGNVGIGTTSPSEKLDVDGFVKSKNYQVSDQGLVLGMNFNSATISGTAGSEKIRDSSGYNNHGTNYGATYNATGGFNGSGVFSFDGIDDYVDCGNDASLNITDAITIEAWVNEIMTGTEKKIVSKRNGSYFYFLGSDAGKLYAGIGNGTNGVNGKSITLGTGWQHVAFTFTNTDKVIRIYKNGVNVENTTITQSLVSFDAKLGIGAETVSPPAWTSYFNGLIDEVRIYNRALSADEIKSHYLQKAEIYNSFVSQKDVYVDSAGNVGIGTTSPGVKLDVSGDANVSGTLSAGAISGSYTGTINASNVTPGYFASNDTPGNYTFTNADKITPILHVDAANNRVGIGTTEPGTKLEVNGKILIPTAPNGYMFFGSGSNYIASDNSGWFEMRSTGANTVSYLGSNYHTILYSDRDQSGAGDIIFRPKNIEAMRITNTGNVGIGTTTPKNKLDIEGGAVVGATYSGTNTAPTNGLLVEGNVGIGTTGPRAKLDVEGGDIWLDDPTFDNDKHVVNVGYVESMVGGAEGVSQGTQAGQTLRWNGSGWVASSNLYNDNTNVGIGTTEPNTKLTISGTPDSATGVIRVISSISTPADSTGGILRFETNTGSNDRAAKIGAVSGVNGYVYFQGIRPGIANDANIVLNPSSGNVGIGTTTPKNKLDIEGGAVVGATYSGTNTAPTNGLLVEGNVGIGTTTPNYTLEVNGTIHTKGFYYEDDSAAEGRVLTALNSEGLAYWKSLSEISGVTGSGTSNYIPKWGTDGTTLINTISPIYEDAAGNVGIGIADPGLNKLNVQGGNVEIGNALTAASGYITGDLTVNTGDLIVGGSDLYVDNTAGNVGIGTTSPQTLLDVRGHGVFGNALTPTVSDTENIINILSGVSSNGAINGIAFMENTDGYGMKIGYDGTGSGVANKLAIYNNADAEIITFQNGGNVGIGTTTPKNKLDIEGGAVVGATYSGTNTAPTNGLLVEGNVGIGTTSPGSYKLNVNGRLRYDISKSNEVIGFYTHANKIEILYEGTGSYPVKIKSTNGDFCAGGSYIRWIEADGTNGITSTPFGGDCSTIELASNGDDSVKYLLWDHGDHRFYWGDSPSDDQQIVGEYYYPGRGKFTWMVAMDRNAFPFEDNVEMTHTLTVAGNVGIGTTSPAQKLHVAGNVRVDGAIVAPEGTLRDDGGGWVRTYGNTGWHSQTYGGGWYMTDTTYLRSYNNKPIYVGAGNSYFGGNVGIGTTSPQGALDMNSQKIVRVAVPTVDTDAANKGYVDDAYQPGGVGVIWNCTTKDADGNCLAGANDIYPRDTNWLVGIGNNNPGVALDVTGDVSNSTQITAGTKLKVGASEMTSSQLIVNGNTIYTLENGKVGIGTTEPSTALEVNGAVTATTFYGNLSGYATTAGSADHATYANSALRAQYLGDSFQVMADAQGRVGIGTTSPGDKLDVREGNVNVALNATVGQQLTVGTKVWTGDGSASLPAYSFSADSNSGLYRLANDKIGLITGGLATKGITIDSTGNVGIGTTEPKNRLDVEGGAVVGATYSGTNTAPSNGLLVEGNVGIGTTDIGDNKLKVNGNVQISSGELTVDESVNISNGNLNMNDHNIGSVGKLTVNVIDPIYEIEGEKYATYVSDFAGGLRMETAGIIKIKNQISNRDEKSKIYEYVIDFDDLEKGSDLWLFWQTSNQDMDDLIVILSPGFEGQVWYKKEGCWLAIYSDEPGEVSYRLLAPRQDYKDWPNLVALQKK